eukprot:56156-Eustigmatos_ZCMA.PRE.1
MVHAHIGRSVCESDRGLHHICYCSECPWRLRGFDQKSTELESGRGVKPADACSAAIVENKLLLVCLGSCARHAWDFVDTSQLSDLSFVMKEKPS